MYRCEGEGYGIICTKPVDVEFGRKLCTFSCLVLSSENEFTFNLKRMDHQDAKRLLLTYNELIF